MIDYEGLADALSGDSEPFGLLSMQASPTAAFLAERFHGRLASLFSAEHGFFGAVSAGESAADCVHPHFGLPVHSLYGKTRTPSPEMMRGISRLVVDLRDIGTRCYTYLATLRNAMRACARDGAGVVVLDSPVPLGGVVDGPMRDEGFDSFVAPLDVPMCHGMTPGECAEWIRREEAPGADLRVVKMGGWSHADRGPWAGFVPPSPAIRSWDSAVMYPATVFTEAYPAVDCDRHGPLAFRVLGAPWLDWKALLDGVHDGLSRLGVSARPYRYSPSGGDYAGRQVDGILLSVSDAAAFRPVRAGMVVLSRILSIGGAEALRGCRPEWMDALFGGSGARLALERGEVEALFPAWDEAAAEFSRRAPNLY